MELSLFFTLFSSLCGPARQAGSDSCSIEHATVERCRTIRVVGRVLTPEGLPARDAVVVTSAGGEAVTDTDGLFEVAVEVSLDARFVDVTAVAEVGADSLAASTRVVPAALSPVTSVGRLVLAPSPGCKPGWLPTFGGEPGVGGFVGVVRAFAVFDDGRGPALYVGGTFPSVSGVPMSGIARWDGSSWSKLGSGIQGAVFALAVFGDGNGEALFAGGNFTSAGDVPASNIARWDGAHWSALGDGVNGFVQALVTFDDGHGPALHAGGTFTSAGGVAANRIARWNGTRWSALGSGVNNAVNALAVFDDGGGPALFVGGSFSSAGGRAASSIARWNGTSWSALGTGTNNKVNALTVFGGKLYAGGSFTGAGGRPANRIARWNGTSWSAVGSGVDSLEVRALAVLDDGTGRALFVGGLFASAGGVPANSIARWDGRHWSALESGMNSHVYALAEFNDRGPSALMRRRGVSQLYAGGAFNLAGGVGADRIARWNGSKWSALGDGLSAYVTALTVFDDGRGPALHVGGGFVTAGGVTLNRIGRWDGASWSPLGSGMDDTVGALAVFDDGSGKALFAAGAFREAGGVSANAIARWNGSSWVPLGSGMVGGGRAPYVSSLVVFDDGSGPALHAAGFFASAGGVAANNIARWNGSSWSALGSGIATNNHVNALTVFDDGSGPALYAGGDFATAGGIPASGIARWNGSSWSAVGSGVNGFGAVMALTVHDDGRGPALYAGGNFGSVGGVAANNIARWDGTAWSALSGGVDSLVYALVSHDDGSGPALYAAGGFTTADGLAASHIARWDGASWSALRGGVDSNVYSLVDFYDGGRRALFAGGLFEVSPAGDSFLARWGCEQRVLPAPPPR